MSVFVIAEAASTHEGSLDRAKRLCDLAYAIGVDAVKFQYCSNYPRFAEKRRITTAFYPFSIDKEWLKVLNDYSKVEFLCTTYLTEDIEVVSPYVNKFKVSAYESKDYDFVDDHPKDRVTLVSNGNCVEINKANLYCVSLYPCPDEKLKLRTVLEDRDYRWDGLSDHTTNPLTGALAAVLGAKYVEFHFRLNDTTPSCPDYEVARSPEEAHTYVRNIRQAEILLG